MAITFFKQAIKKFTIKEGTIWRAPNSIWTTDFAKNKDGAELHPAVIERIHRDNITVYLAPGSTKGYREGSCVFKTKLKGSGKTSHFLLSLTMARSKKEFRNLDQGWSGVNRLDEKQIDDLRWHIKICKGIVVQYAKQKKWWQKIY